MNILQLIASNSFISTNKLIIKKYGLVEANIVGFFASIDNYNNEHTKEYDGWFYVTYDKIEGELNVSKHISSKAIEALIKSKILMDKKKGVPCRRYFKFNQEELFKCFGVIPVKPEESGPPPEVKNFNSLELNNLTTSSENSSPQAVKNFNRNNNTNNNTNNNSSFYKSGNSELLEKEEEIKKLEDLLKNNYQNLNDEQLKRQLTSYFNLKGYKSDVERFLLYYNGKTQKLFENMPYWALTWENKFLQDVQPQKQSPESSSPAQHVSQDVQNVQDKVKLQRAITEYCAKNYTTRDRLTHEEICNIKNSINIYDN